MFKDKNKIVLIRVTLLLAIVISISLDQKFVSLIFLCMISLVEYFQFRFQQIETNKKDNFIKSLLRNINTELPEELKYLQNDFKQFKQYQEKVISALRTIQNSRVVEEILLGEEKKELVKVILEISDSVERDKQDLMFQKVELISRNKDLELAQKFLEDKSKELQKLTNHKSKFLANMSHEFRTPLNGIINFSNFALESNEKEEKEAYIVNIKESGTHLLGIINDILDISAIEAGKFKLIKENFNIKKKVDFVVEIAKTMAKSKNVEIIPTIDSSIPKILYGDSRRFTQVLINLINNSVKFNKENGSIIINIFSENITNEYIKIGINISDTGKGISEKFQKEMFKPFTQADDSMKRSHEGSGLGLAITAHILKLMSGEIEIQSKVNLGSNFKVSIPFKFEQVLKVNNIKPKTTLGKKLNILVAEDNDINQKIVRKIVEDANHNVVLANDGIKALKEFKENQFDLVLMDIQMPNMDGLETTTKILELEKEMGRKHVPIIALTAHALLEEKRKYLNHGMDGYVTKPIVKETLIEEINKLID